MPVPGHRCVCGKRFITFGNLVAHRKLCDSWAEHQRGIRHAHPAPAEPPVAADRPECPYCARECGSFPLLLAHLKSCSGVAERWDAAVVAEVTVDRVIRTFEKQLDFAAWEWRRANGVPDG